MHRTSTIAYRHWAQSQQGLPLYWQPRWLDIVAPETWEAQSDDWADPSWVWPFVARSWVNQRIIALPDSTAFLGPRLLKHSAIPALPEGMAYGLYTFHQPALAWSVGARPRAMASLILPLSEPPAHSARRRHRLRAANSKLSCEPSNASDLIQLQSLLDEPEVIVPVQCNRILWEAKLAGVGEVWLARDGAGLLHGAIGIVWDNESAYVVFCARSPRSHPSAGLLLYQTAIDELRGIGLRQLNFQAGYLPGPRDFFIRLGAKPQFYAQVRATSGPFWKLAEAFRARTNSKRL